MSHTRVRRTEYEHPNVLELRKEQERLRKQTEEKLANIESQIAEERSAQEFLHGLLINTAMSSSTMSKQLSKLSDSEILSIPISNREGKTFRKICRSTMKARRFSWW